MTDAAATAWDEASREMRERAMEAARRAYPDAAAMMRAIAALPVAPSPLSRETATLTKTGATTARIERAGRSVTLSGATVPMILAWHEHMTEHGRAWGETYLAGLSHGLAHAAATKLDDVLRNIETRQSRIDELRAGKPDA